MLPTAEGSRVVAGLAVEDTGKAVGQEDLQGTQPVPELERACRAHHTHIHTGYMLAAFDRT